MSCYIHHTRMDTLQYEPAYVPSDYSVVERSCDKRHRRKAALHYESSYVWLDDSYHRNLHYIHYTGTAVPHSERKYVSSDNDYNHRLHSEMHAFCYEYEAVHAHYPGKKAKNKHINITFIIRGMGFKSGMTLLIITLKQPRPLPNHVLRISIWCTACCSK